MRPDSDSSKTISAASIASAQVSAKFQQAFALHKQGRLAQAQAIYEEILNMQPEHFDSLHLLGVIAAQTKNPDRAIKLFDKAIGIKPDYAEVHKNRGLVLKELKQLKDALASYDKAIALKPDYVEAHINRGEVLHELKQLDAALASCDKAIALKPDYAEAHNNRGAVLHELGQLDAALASCDKAIALKPGYAKAYYNRSVVLYELEQLDAALASCDKAIALIPNYADACFNRGNVLQKLNRLDAAIESYGEAIALKPGFVNAYWNMSVALLSSGNFDRGWELYEWRWMNESLASQKRNHSQPLWLGRESISGKAILLHCEQGLGDTIQFCRYARLVANLGARVILQVQKPLMSLMAGLEGVAQFIEEGSALPEFDYHCPLASLPLAFKTNLSTIPANIPYLNSNAEKILSWKEKLGGNNKLRVGLVWSGGFRPNKPELLAVNRRRNIPLAKLAALKLPDIEFYSLQKGQQAESELAQLILQNWDGPPINDLTSLLNDFSDTAALIENLDLVISVDTSTAHLAGALGKPVWILNRFDTCWRWLLDREDSPWYPTARIYRQSVYGDWDDVVQRVKADLINLLKR